MSESDPSRAPRLLRRFSSIELLIALGLLIFLFPLIEESAWSGILESILFSVVLLSALFAIANRKTVVIVAALLVLPALTARWIHLYRPDIVPPEIFLIGGILFLLFAIWNLLRFVLTSPEVDLEILCASLSAFILLGLLWTFAYWLVAELNPDAFSFNIAAESNKTMQGFNSFYFSFITLSTVGYGDITPVAKVARMLAATEAMTGLLYVAVLIARLVTLYSTPKSNER